MSRSYRKSPYNYDCGGSPSDRESKIIWHGKMRAAIRCRLANSDPDEILFPHHREVSNAWDMKADCKFRFNPRENPQWLRK